MYSLISLRLTREDFALKLKFLEGLLLIFFIGMAVYIGMGFKKEYTGESMPSMEGSPVAANGDGESASLFPSLRPYPYYADKFKERDLFAPLGTAPVNMAQSQNPPEIGHEFPSHLRISGIILGNPSEAVIEDKNANSSYFLKEGESSGDLQILKVNKDSVSVNYLGKMYQFTIERP